MTRKARSNVWDYFRLILSFTVLVSHYVALSGYSEFYFLNEYFNSELAVYLFFGVSGYFMRDSYISSLSVVGFYFKRVARIYPAYFATIILFILVFVVIHYKEGYVFSFYDLVKYAFVNLLFMNFLSPSFSELTASSYSSAINGSLWTLKVELMFYLFVPLLHYIFCKFRPFMAFMLIYIFSYIYINLVGYFYSYNSSLINQAPALISFFLIGYFVKYSVENIKYKFDVAVVFLLLVIGCIFTLNNAVYLLITFLVIFALHYISYSRFSLNKLPLDISFSLYLVHFPIVQALYLIGFFDILDFYSSFMVVLFLSIALSIFFTKNLEFIGLNKLRSRHG